MKLGAVAGFAAHWVLSVPPNPGIDTLFPKLQFRGYNRIFSQPCLFLVFTHIVDQRDLICEGFSNRYKIVGILKVAGVLWRKPTLWQDTPQKQKTNGKPTGEVWGITMLSGDDAHCRCQPGSLSLGRGDDCCACGYHLAARKKGFSQGCVLAMFLSGEEGARFFECLACFVLKRLLKWMQHNPYCIMKHQESCEVGDDSATCQSEDGSGKHSGMGRSQSFETTQTVRQSGFSLWNADMSHILTIIFIPVIYIYIVFLLVYKKKNKILYFL